MHPYTYTDTHTPRDLPTQMEPLLFPPRMTGSMAECEWGKELPERRESVETGEQCSVTAALSVLAMTSIRTEAALILQKDVERMD